VDTTSVESTDPFRSNYDCRPGGDSKKPLGNRQLTGFELGCRANRHATTGKGSCFHHSGSAFVGPERADARRGNAPNGKDFISFGSLPFFFLSRRKDSSMKDGAPPQFWAAARRDLLSALTERADRSRQPRRELMARGLAGSHRRGGQPALSISPLLRKVLERWSIGRPLRDQCRGGRGLLHFVAPIERSAAAASTCRELRCGPKPPKLPARLFADGGEPRRNRPSGFPKQLLWPTAS